MWNFKRRRELKNRDAFQALHERARADRSTLVSLLHGEYIADFGVAYAYPWLISEDDAFRSAFRWLEAEFKRRREQGSCLHWSLRAHDERLIELLIDAMANFVDPTALTSPEKMKADADTCKLAFKELAELNARAWDRETEAKDVTGQIAGVLTDARSTVRDLLPEA